MVNEVIAGPKEATPEGIVNEQSLDVGRLTEKNSEQIVYKEKKQIKLETPKEKTDVKKKMSTSTTQVDVSWCCGHSEEIPYGVPLVSFKALYQQQQ